MQGEDHPGTPLTRGFPARALRISALFRRRAQFDVVSIAARQTGSDGVDDTCALTEGIDGTPART